MKRKKLNISDLNKYKCEWCEIEKTDNQFFKCSTNKKIYICSSCIKRKYEEICSKHGKLLAIVICCHYLDIAFNDYAYNALKEGQGIGYYVKQLNLLQNQNTENFEQGLITSNVICCRNDNNNRIAGMKNKLNSIIKELEIFKNDI